MKVIPAPDRAIRDPATMQLVPAEGLVVDATAPFWARALLDGDLLEAPEDEECAAEPVPTADAVAPAPPPPGPTPRGSAAASDEGSAE